MVDSVVAVENDSGLAYQACAVGRHFADCHNTIETGTRSCPGIGKISLAVGIPQRSRVYHALAAFHEHRLAPFAFGVGCLYHIDAEIRVAPINIVLAVVIAYTGRPHAFAVAGSGIIEICRRNSRKSVVHYSPVDEVCRFENRQTGSALKTRGCHIECAPVGGCNRVGVGIICFDYRVDISAAFHIGRIRYKLHLTGCRSQRGTNQYQKKFQSIHENINHNTYSNLSLSHQGF